MTFEKLRDRAVLGLEGSTIRLRALEYLYEAESDMCLRAKCYQKSNMNLMVDPADVNKVTMPSDFSEFYALPEWRSVPLYIDPLWRDYVRRKTDGSWYSGTPYKYFMENNILFLNPEPSSYVGDYKLGIWYIASAPSTHDAVAEITNITCFKQSTLSGGEYFYISNTATDFYVWFDLDNGSSDPAISGRTGVEIDVTTDDSASTIATAVKTAIDALTDLSATVSGATVTVTNDSTGAVKSIALDVDSGVLINVTTDGQGAVLSPVFDDSYHIYLHDYAKAMLLIDDRRDGSYHLQRFENNLAMVKAHFKSRVSPNITRIQAEGVIRRGGGFSPFSRVQVYNVTSVST